MTSRKSLYQWRSHSSQSSDHSVNSGTGHQHNPLAGCPPQKQFCSACSGQLLCMRRDLRFHHRQTWSCWFWCTVQHLAKIRMPVHSCKICHFECSLQAFCHPTSQIWLHHLVNTFPGICASCCLSPPYLHTSSSGWCRTDSPLCTLPCRLDIFCKLTSRAILRCHGSKYPQHNLHVCGTPPRSHSQRRRFDNRGICTEMLQCRIGLD